MWIMMGALSRPGTCGVGIQWHEIPCCEHAIKFTLVFNHGEVPNLVPLVMDIFGILTPCIRATLVLHDACRPYHSECFLGSLLVDCTSSSPYSQASEFLVLIAQRRRSYASVEHSRVLRYDVRYCHCGGIHTKLGTPRAHIMNRLLFRRCTPL